MSTTKEGKYHSSVGRQILFSLQSQRVRCAVCIFLSALTLLFLLYKSTDQVISQGLSENALNAPDNLQKFISGNALEGTIPVIPEKPEIKTPEIKTSELIEHTKTKPKIAYAVTVTKDGPFVDGALVLGYSAHKYHRGDYDIELVAFVTSSVVTARPILEKFGWKIMERGLPVQLEEIENQAYAEKMRGSGCCGADEFLKLWAYNLTQYHRVIHLDMDSIIYQNMDDVFNQDYELLFTGDYNMMTGPVPPAQGGFLVIRPSVDTFEEFRSIIKKGDYGSGGWAKSKIGNFWGGQTIQGIVPYFYHVIHPGNAKELNRCEYNCMVDNPYKKNTANCLDKKPTCQDCRQQHFNLVRSAHFTICQKPWTCNEHTNPRNSRLCTIFHDKWFELRDELEKSLHIDSSYRADLSTTRYKKSMGMCKRYGNGGYLPIPVVGTPS